MRALGLGLVTAALLLTAARALADNDPWFGRDKALHFSVSAALAGGGYAGGALAFDGRPARLASGATFALSLGIAKELYDLAGHGDASWRDLTWDLAGTLTGLVVSYCIDRYLLARPPRPSPVARALAARTDNNPWFGP